MEINRNNLIGILIPVAVTLMLIAAVGMIGFSVWKKVEIGRTGLPKIFIARMHSIENDSTIGYNDKQILRQVEDVVQSKQVSFLGICLGVGVGIAVLKDSVITDDERGEIVAVRDFLVAKNGDVKAKECNGFLDKNPGIKKIFEAMQAKPGQNVSVPGKHHG